VFHIAKGVTPIVEDQYLDHALKKFSTTGYQLD